MNGKTLANLSLITGVVLPYVMAKKTAGSRSLEDILYLGETRGGKHFVKISRKLALDTADLVRRNDALHEIVQGELAVRKMSRDPNKSDNEYYYELFGLTWEDVNPDYKFTTDSTIYGSRTLADMKYDAQKHIFDQSTNWSGATYYIKFKPEDMYDPIEEDGFALLNRDAATNLSYLYQQRDFLVGKYGNRDRYPQDLAMKNLEALGYQTFGDLLEAGANHRASPSDFQRIKTNLERNFKVEDDQIHLVNFLENVWKKAWTVPARMDARIRARRIK